MNDGAPGREAEREFGLAAEPHSDDTSDATDLGAERAMRAIVIRLSRASASGEAVIERAAIMAEGADSHAIVGWILAHGGRPEASAPSAPARGLHGARWSGDAGRSSPPPRYVLPAGTLP